MDTIRKYFEKKGNDIRIFTSINEDGEDQLERLIHELSEEAKENEQEDDPSNSTDQPQIDKCDEILMRLGALKSTERQTD